MTTPQSPVLGCTEFVATEGQYELLQDIFLDQVLPHPVIPTYISSISVKNKDYPGIGISGGGAAKVNSTGVHRKQNSADSTLSSSNIDRLEERLQDIKLKDEHGDDDESRVGGASLGRNFHGRLIDLPQYNDDNSSGGFKSPLSEVMSPSLSHASTPGVPALKESIPSANRVSDPYSQFGRPSAVPVQQPSQHQPSFRNLSRANSGYSPGLDDSSGPSSFAGSPSTGFSSFFGSKKKKPKNNITKTNSTFVAKIATHENLAKILANRVGEDVYLFWNTGRTFTWSNMDQKPNEPLSHISFTKAFPTSHDVNVLTRSSVHLDVIIGFSTGDIMWFDPLCNKYYRLNKQAVVKDSAVTMIKWMPGSESQFMVAFHDGSILIMDKERDDSAFSMPAPPNDNLFHVTRPKHSKHNPISHWQVCRKPITAFAFSPDLQHIAVVSMDGYLRIIDFRDEKLLDTFSAYFGSLSCVCWSPDGKYILVVTAQRRGSTATVQSMGTTGSGFKPGHGSKGSIGSLRGNGGFSLFSGHTNAKSQDSLHQRRKRQSSIVEEPSLEHENSQRLLRQSQAGERSSTSLSSVGSRSTSQTTIRSSTPVLQENGYNQMLPSSTTATLNTGNSVTSHSIGHHDGTSTPTTIDIGTPNEVYKKSAHARTLPHLPQHKPHSGLTATSADENPEDEGLVSDTHQRDRHRRVEQEAALLCRNGTKDNFTVQVIRPAEPRSHLAMLQPLLATTVHQEPLSGIVFREDAIMTSDRRGHIKVWKRPKPLPHP
ncbi:hypothetical protein BGZ98_004195 [Dissophora globulifera]|nr:hypothetical protein BGZ98_004195 [Dissophora globulifera]